MYHLTPPQGWQLFPRAWNPYSCSPASGRSRAPPAPQAGSPTGDGGEPHKQGHHNGHRPGGQGPKHSRGCTGGRCWRGREQKQENQRQGDGGGLSGQHGRGQTQGLSWEVAGGAGVPVLGRDARLLRGPRQPGTRDPGALGPRKQTSHTARMMRVKRHVAALHRPRAPRPRCRLSRVQLCQAHECPSRLLHFCCCHWPSPESPSPGVPCSSLHRRRATCREGRGAGCPHWTDEQAGVGGGGLEGRTPRASYPHSGQRRFWWPAWGLGPTHHAQPPCSLLGHLAGSHLPASRASGPLVSAS